MLILQISQAQIIELTKNVEGHKGAIVVLFQFGAFPQLQLDFLSLSSHVHNPTGDELDHVSSWIAMHQSSRIVRITGLRQNVCFAPNVAARTKIHGLYQNLDMHQNSGFAPKYVDSSNIPGADH